MSRPRHASWILALILSVAALILQAPIAASQQRAATLQSQLPSDVVSWLAEAAADPSLEPWQREFMLEVAQGGHEGASLEASKGLPATPLASAGLVAADGAWNPVPPPSGRTWHDAIYDSVRGRMLVIGGWEGRPLNDVWVLPLSGSPAWSVLAVGETRPPGRRGHTAIYDPLRDRIVVFGGQAAVYFNDVWALSLAESPAWVALTPAGSPPTARTQHTAIYDPVRDRMVVFGGVGTSGLRNDVWALSLSGSVAWSMLAPAGALPDGRRDHTAIYDSVRDRMVVFGGFGGSARPNDVWALSLSGSLAWSTLAPAGALPNGREDHTTIYDSVRDRMVVFGGRDLGPSFNDVWALSLSGSTSWSQLAPEGSLRPGLYQHTAIYDPVGDRMVVFGGLAGTSAERTNEVWTLMLSESPVWHILVPGSPIVGRGAHTAIYDSARDRMVVFGGYDGGLPANVGNDVWALSLSGSPVWSALAPAGSRPTARRDHTAIYDPVRDRMVIFGGYDGSLRNDVWALSFSGSPEWSALAPAGGSPTSRDGHTAIYDPVRDRMVVFGGLAAGYFNDVWALSFAESPAWFALTPEGSPPTARTEHTAIYDPARDRMVVFGGYDIGGYRNDVWALSLAGSPVWSALAPAGGAPTSPPRTAIYDSMRDRMVVFEGYPTRTDVWALSLSGSLSWSTLAPAGGPPDGRLWPSTTYDPVRDRVVVFGGFDSGGYRNDVWTLDWGSPTVPALVSLAHAEAGPDRVSLTWYGSESAGLAGSVERREETTDWRSLATISADGTGTYRYDDRAVAPGVRYAYRLAYRDGDGAETVTAEAWVEVPVTLSLALEGLRPNPSRTGFVAVFVLPDDEAAVLAVHDIAGRQVLTREVGSLGAGRHTLRLANPGELRAGIYWLRLDRMGRSLLAKAVVLQ